MNNATNEQPLPPVSLPHHEADDSQPVASANQSFGNEKANLSAVLTRLDEIRYAPRAATIRAIMRYAHEKDEALH